jgi:hypothetical protein
VFDSDKVTVHPDGGDRRRRCQRLAGRTDSEPGGTVFTPLARTKPMSEAFQGTENPHYDDLAWDRRFKNLTIDHHHADRTDRAARERRRGGDGDRPGHGHRRRVARRERHRGQPPGGQARYTLTFKPRGSKRTLTKSKVVTIPART